MRTSTRILHGFGFLTLITSAIADQKSSAFERRQAPPAGTFVVGSPTTIYSSGNLGTVADFGYTQQSVTFTSLTNSAILTISARNDNGRFDYDDFSVVKFDDPAAVNTVQNPGFETGSLLPWYSVSGPGSAAPGNSAGAAFTGAYGLAVDNTGGQTEVVAQVIPTEPNTVYTVSFYVRSVGSSNAVTSVTIQSQVEPPTIIGLTPQTDDGVSNSDGQTTVPNPVLIGTGDFSTTIEVSINGVSSGTASPLADGTFSYQLPNLQAGTSLVTVIGTTANGQQTPTSPSYTIVLTPVAPTIVLDPAYDTGNKGDGITSSQNLNLIGTAVPNGAILITDGGNQIASGVANNDGTWSFFYPTSEGSHSFRVFNVPDQYNTGPSTVLDITIVSIPNAPVVTGLSPASDDGVAGDGQTTFLTPTIIGTGSPGSTVVLYDGNNVAVGTGPVDNAGDFAITTSSLFLGYNILYGTQTDVNGEVSNAGASSVVIVVPQKPVVTTLSPTDGTNGNGDPTTSSRQPTIAGSGSPDVVITITENGETVGSGQADNSGDFTSTITNPLTPGIHTFILSATYQGYSSEPSQPYTIEVVELASSSVIFSSTQSSDIPLSTSAEISSTLSSVEPSVTVSFASQSTDLSTISESTMGSATLSLEIDLQSTADSSSAAQSTPVESVTVTSFQSSLSSEVPESTSVESFTVTSGSSLSTEIPESTSVESVTVSIQSIISTEVPSTSVESVTVSSAQSTVSSEIPESTSVVTISITSDVQSSLSIEVPESTSVESVSATLTGGLETVTISSEVLQTTSVESTLPVTLSAIQTTATELESSVLSISVTQPTSAETVTASLSTPSSETQSAPVEMSTELPVSSTAFGSSSSGVSEIPSASSAVVSSAAATSTDVVSIPASELPGTSTAEGSASSGPTGTATDIVTSAPFPTEVGSSTAGESEVSTRGFSTMSWSNSSVSISETETSLPTVSPTFQSTSEVSSPTSIQGSGSIVPSSSIPISGTVVPESSTISGSATNSISGSASSSLESSPTVSVPSSSGEVSATLTASATATPTVSPPFFLTIQFASLRKRQTGPSYLTLVNGQLVSTQSCAALPPVEFSIDANRLRAENLFATVSTAVVANPGFSPVQFQAASADIQTVFSIDPAGALVWSNSAFSNVNAGFCLLNNVVQATFSVPVSSIPNCIPISLVRSFDVCGIDTSSTAVTSSIGSATISGNATTSTGSAIATSSSTGTGLGPTVTPIIVGIEIIIQITIINVNIVVNGVLVPTTKTETQTITSPLTATPAPSVGSSVINGNTVYFTTTVACGICQCQGAVPGEITAYKTVTVCSACQATPAPPVQTVIPCGTCQALVPGPPVAAGPPGSPAGPPAGSPAGSPTGSPPTNPYSNYVPAGPGAQSPPTAGAPGNPGVVPVPTTPAAGPTSKGGPIQYTGGASKITSQGLFVILIGGLLLI